MNNFLPPVYGYNNKKIKIAVAISGGVDSSVVLAILKDKGYDLIGVYFKTYKPDGDRTYCKKEGSDAKKICEYLKVPFFAIDLEQEYKKDVFNYMIQSYKNGLTPNPDIICNKKIKFGHFIEKISEKENIDYIATGHYAKHYFNKEGNKHFLVKAIDQKKDQTYFLSQISKKSLEKSLFPLGELEKKEVRVLAEKYGLFTAKKRDSQGICFIQKEVKIKDFLNEFIETKKGDILDIYGKKIGEHDGSIFFTIGQRHGFEIFPQFKKPNQGRIFIISKDFKNNTITVAEKEYLQKVKDELSRKEIFVKDFNFVSNSEIKKDKRYFGRIRHRGSLIECLVEKNSSNNGEYKIIFKNPQSSIASGQFLALYEEEICIGSGVIV